MLPKKCCWELFLKADLKITTREFCFYALPVLGFMSVFFICCGLLGVVFIFSSKNIGGVIICFRAGNSVCVKNVKIKKAIGVAGEKRVSIFAAA